MNNNQVEFEVDDIVGIVGTRETGVVIGMNVNYALVEMVIGGEQKYFPLSKLELKFREFDGGWA